LKVLIVHNQQAGLPSGERLVAEDDMAHLQAAGVDVRLHLVESSPPQQMTAMQKGRTALNLVWSFPAMRNLGRVLDEYEPDVVHFHSILPELTPSAFAACHKRKIAVVQTLHNFRWLCVEGGLYRNEEFCDACIGGGSWRGVRFRCARGSLSLSGLLAISNLAQVGTRELFKRVDTFIAVSKFVRDTYVRGGFPGAKIALRYNAISKPARVQGARRQGIVFVGRLTPAKGTRHLKRLMQALPEVRMTIVGTGPEENDLKAFAEAHGLANVVFVGRVDQRGVYEQIAGAECVVIPSVSGETFGRVAIEAMAMATPLVVSNIGGLGEVVEGNPGAVGVDPTDSQAFVVAVRGIVGSAQRVEEMGQAGRAFADEHWFMGDPARELVAIYEETIRSKARRAL
jgi:glycosyltransferase involved in cell wall biosynthesis